MHTPSYDRLSVTDREEISRGLEAGRSYAEIARCLDRETSTVSREVNQSGGRVAYRALHAQTQAQQRAGSRRSGKRTLFNHAVLQSFVHEHLLDNWSPEQISVSLKEVYPLDTTMRISDEAIYQYLYVLPKGELKRRLIAGLRQERKYRRKRKEPAKKGQETRGKIADMLSIEERPEEVADRTVPGHWEGDLLLGKYRQSAVGTLVERTTRYTLIVPLPAKDAASVRKALAKAIRTLPQALTKTLTYDQGKEMSQHQQFTVDTGMTVYFAHPGSPWERGTNENTNMLIRQYFPKGTDFHLVTRADITAAQRSLNRRPRKSLGFKTPEETLQALLR